MDKNAPIDKKTEIELLSGTKFLEFNFNSFVDLEDEYGGFKETMDTLAVGKLKDIRFVLYIGLKEHYKYKNVLAVGKELSMLNLASIGESLMVALKKVLPIPTEEEEATAKEEKEVDTKK